MSDTTLALTDELLSYLRLHSVHESELLRELREETHRTFEAAPMQIAPEQGQFFRFLLSIINAKKAIELGTFTGYSSVCIAESLPADGHLTCCDLSKDWTKLAVKYWEKMGLTNKITLKLQPALTSLNELIVAGEAATYDFAFIDADKPNYPNYYELCLQLLRKGGVLAIDNTLWGGSVIDESDQAPDTKAIRELNDRAVNDKRVVSCIVPIGDGLTLVTKL